MEFPYRIPYKIYKGFPYKIPYKIYQGLSTEKCKGSLYQYTCLFFTLMTLFVYFLSLFTNNGDLKIKNSRQDHGQV